MSMALDSHLQLYFTFYKSRPVENGCSTFIVGNNFHMGPSGELDSIDSGPEIAALLPLFSAPAYSLAVLGLPVPGLLLLV